MDAVAALSSVDWPAVVAAAAASFVLGALWYGPFFGAAWQDLVGLDEEELDKTHVPLLFGAAFLLELVAAGVLALFLGPEAGALLGLAAGGSVGVFWVAPAVGVIYLFERRPFLHWVIDAGYQVMGFLVMGGVLGLWP